jgi:polysaccharide pyruvyl transferase WcaK-like protein
MQMSDSGRRPRLAIFGTFGAGNLGNECTLEAMLYNVRRYVPNVDLVCICQGPEEIASRHNVSAFPIRSSMTIRKMSRVVRQIKRSSMSDVLRRLVKILLEPYRWHKAVRMLKGSDMLVVTGLGMLGDFGIRPFGLHYDILGWSVIAKLCGCRLLFVSVGVGPIRNPISRCFVKAALLLGDYRSYRDDFSRHYAESLGVQTATDSVYPDLAFSLPRAMLPRSRERTGDSAVIGIGLMNYYSRVGQIVEDVGIYNTYTTSVVSLMIKLLERGHAVRLLIGDVVYDEKTRFDVRRLVEERGWTYDDENIIDEPASSVSEILSQLAATDVVVASRFHNLVLALMLGKPVVAVSYHEKIVELLNQVGLAQFCQDIEDIDIDRLIGQFTKLQEGVEGCKVRIGVERRTEAYRRALDEQYGLIFGTVGG